MTQLPNTRQPSRRRFIDWLLGTSFGALLAALVYPVTRFLIPPEAAESSSTSVTVPFTAQDIPANSGRIFKFGNRPGILIRTPENELRAFSAVCTHLGCTVQYRPDFSHIWCACHNGHFDLHGVNIAGPPPSPLDGFSVNVRDEQIVVGKGS
jgi:Rieske Fe-S protein